MNIFLKQIQSDDFEALKSLFLKNNQPVITNTFHPFPLTVETAWWMSYQPRLDRFYIALLGGAPVGFSMLRGWDEGYDVPSFGVFIDFDYHGKGIGNYVLTLTMEEARKIGCKKIRLSVYASNLAALVMYQHKGFVEIERAKVDHLGLPDQKITMVKEL